MDFIHTVYSSYPCAGESDSVRQFFWATVAATWLLSFVPQHGRRNYSIVDRLWSLFPLLLTVQWAYHQDGSPTQLTFISKPQAAVVLVTVWSLRLTYSSIRRGDYAVGAEDYRWAHVRSSFDRALGSHGILRTVAWELFNFSFISLFQLALLYQISVPVRQILANNTEWSTPQLALAAVMSLLLVAEAVADCQQYELQRLKRPGVLASEPNRAYAETRLPEVNAGFVYSGLWRVSRHPNVFCEQAFWIAIASFAYIDGGCAFGLFAGAALLVSLMWASVGLTESISLRKYPLYRAYQLKTSRLVPCLPRSNAQVVGAAYKHQKKPE
ncbi:hypothetical protein GGI20_000965 [Coemansia sp. BCRC 34301]|nr:hypothetical protein GGI20_000965 [Coemansia sp. BCRC 34301]